MANPELRNELALEAEAHGKQTTGKEKQYTSAEYVRHRNALVAADKKDAKAQWWVWDYNTNRSSNNAKYKSNLQDWTARAKRQSSSLDTGFNKLDGVMMTHLAWTDANNPLSMSEFSKEMAASLKSSKIDTISLSKDIAAGDDYKIGSFSDQEMDNLIKNMPATVKNISIDGSFSERNLNTLLNWVEQHPGVSLHIDTQKLQGYEKNEGKISAETFKRLCNAGKKGQIKSLSVSPEMRSYEDDKLLSPPVGDKEGYGSLGNVSDTSGRISALRKAFGSEMRTTTGNYIFISEEQKQKVGKEKLTPSVKREKASGR